MDLLGVKEKQTILEDQTEEPSIGQLEETGAGDARLWVGNAQLEGLWTESHRDDWSRSSGQTHTGSFAELTAQEDVCGVLGRHG